MTSLFFSVPDTIHHVVGVTGFSKNLRPGMTLSFLFDAHDTDAVAAHVIASVGWGAMTDEVARTTLIRAGDARIFRRHWVSRVGYVMMTS